MDDRYRVVEIYKGGEKVFKGKAYRVGWRVYKGDKKGNWVYDKDLLELK